MKSLLITLLTLASSSAFAKETYRFETVVAATVCTKNATKPCVSNSKLEIVTIDVVPNEQDTDKDDYGSTWTTLQVGAQQLKVRLSIFKAPVGREFMGGRYLLNVTVSSDFSINGTPVYSEIGSIQGNDLNSSQATQFSPVFSDGGNSISLGIWIQPAR